MPTRTADPNDVFRQHVRANLAANRREGMPDSGMFAEAREAFNKALSETTANEDLYRIVDTPRGPQKAATLAGCLRWVFKVQGMQGRYAADLVTQESWWAIVERIVREEIDRPPA